MSFPFPIISYTGEIINVTDSELIDLATEIENFPLFEDIPNNDNPLYNMNEYSFDREMEQEFYFDENNKPIETKRRFRNLNEISIDRFINDYHLVPFGFSYYENFAKNNEIPNDIKFPKNLSFQSKLLSIENNLSPYNSLISPLINDEIWKLNYNDPIFTNDTTPSNRSFASDLSDETLYNDIRYNNRGQLTLNLFNNETINLSSFESLISDDDIYWSRRFLRHR